MDFQGENEQISSPAAVLFPVHQERASGSRIFQKPVLAHFYSKGDYEKVQKSFSF